MGRTHLDEDSHLHTRARAHTHSLRVHRKLQDGLTSEISRSEGGLSLEPPGLPGEPPLYAAPQLPLSPSGPQPSPHSPVSSLGSMRPSPEKAEMPGLHQAGP